MPIESCILFEFSLLETEEIVGEVAVSISDDATGQINEVRRSLWSLKREDAINLRVYRSRYIDMGAALMKSLDGDPVPIALA